MAERDGRLWCDWCDGERITCEGGWCADDGPHECPRGLGAPLTPSEIRPGEWMQFHADCRRKFSELMAHLGRKGVRLSIDGMDVRP